MLTNKMLKSTKVQQKTVSTSSTTATAIVFAALLSPAVPQDPPPVPSACSDAAVLLKMWLTHPSLHLCRAELPLPWHLLPQCCSGEWVHLGLPADSMSPRAFGPQPSGFALVPWQPAQLPWPHAELPDAELISFQE